MGFLSWIFGTGQATGPSDADVSGGSDKERFSALALMSEFFGTVLRV